MDISCSAGTTIEDNRVVRYKHIQSLLEVNNRYKQDNLARRTFQTTCFMLTRSVFKKFNASVKDNLQTAIIDLSWLPGPAPATS